MGIEANLESTLAAAVRSVGSQSAFARLIGMSQGSVYTWLANGKPLPAEHVLKVSAATGIAKEALRPDLYPVETGPALPTFTRIGDRA